jgi:hypothetical protein
MHAAIVRKIPILRGRTPPFILRCDYGWIQEIIRADPDAVLETEGAATQDGVSGERSVYSIGKAESELDLLVVQHSWFLKIRATYPGQCSTQAREAMGAFRTAWTGRGR